MPIVESKTSKKSEQIRTRVHPIVAAAMTIVILTSLLPHTRYLPSMLAYAVVVTAYLLFMLIAIFIERETELTSPRWAIASLVIIWGVYIGHMYLDLATGSIDTGALVRIPPFVVLTGLNLFYIPRVVSRDTFLYILARMPAVLVIIGLPTLFVDGYSLELIRVVSGNDKTLPFGVGTRNIVSSVFVNPNTMSFVTMVGLLSAYGEYVTARSRVVLALVILNGLGLYLASGRGSMFAAIAGISLFVIYQIISISSFRRLYAFAGVAGLLLLLSVFNYLPAPAIIANIGTQGRDVIWAGAVSAVMTQPVFGFGAGKTGQFIAPFITGKWSGYGPHNSYLRLFVETGIIGGIAYALFIARILLGRLFFTSKTRDLTILALCTSIAISMIFSGYTLFGISCKSLISSLIFGYGLHSVKTKEIIGRNII